MGQTSSGGTSDWARMKRIGSAKAQRLRTSSAIAVGRVLQNAILPGAVIAASLLATGSHLEAFTIASDIEGAVNSVKAITSAKGGSPVIAIPLGPDPRTPTIKKSQFSHATPKAAAQEVWYTGAEANSATSGLGNGWLLALPRQDRDWSQAILRYWRNAHEALVESSAALRPASAARLSQPIDNAATLSLAYAGQIANSLANTFGALDFPVPVERLGGNLPLLPSSVPAVDVVVYTDRRLWEFSAASGDAPESGGAIILDDRHTEFLPSTQTDPNFPVSGTGAPVTQVATSSSAVTTSDEGSLVEAAPGEGVSPFGQKRDHNYPRGREDRIDYLVAAELGENRTAFGVEGPRGLGIALVNVADRAAGISRDFSRSENVHRAYGADTAAPIPVGAFALHNGEVHVSLGAIIEALGDRFDEPELTRLRESSAKATFVPLSVLHDNGIPVRVAGTADSWARRAELAQPSTATSGLSSGAGGAQSGSSAALSRSLALTASAGYDSNPFLTNTPDPGVASARLMVMPSLKRRGERTNLSASGRFEHVEYLGQYQSLQNYGADVAASHRLTERLQLDAAALFRSDVLGTNLTNPLSGPDIVDPIEPGLPGGGDVTILGQRQRREQFGADAGLTLTPSARDQLRWSASFRGDRFATGNLSESNFYSQQLRYSRQVTGAISFGAVVDASIIDFTDAAFGDTQTVSPQALVVAKFGERFEASAALGVAISKVELAAGNQTDTALAGRASLCYRSEVSRLCANGARQVLPSAIGGARLQTTGGLTYSLRMSERDSLQVGGSYSTASEPIAALGGEFESINAFARYERTLNERMRLQASVGYIDTSGGAAVNASSFQALLGISIKFGQDR